jgi:hypothetical protein
VTTSCVPVRAACVLVLLISPRKILGTGAALWGALGPRCGHRGRLVFGSTDQALIMSLPSAGGMKIKIKKKIKITTRVDRDRSSVLS